MLMSSAGDHHLLHHHTLTGQQGEWRGRSLSSRAQLDYPSTTAQHRSPWHTAEEEERILSQCMMHELTIQDGSVSLLRVR